jgi:hypothetical protein
MMRAFLVILLLLVSLPCWATFTQSQVVVNRTNSTCGITSGTSCTMTVTACGSNHLLILIVYLSSTSTASAVSGCGGTWIHATGCESAPTNGLVEDCWYNLTPNVGSTSVVATVPTGKASGGDFYEYSSTGTPTFDNANSTVNGNTANTSQPGVAPLVSGANEAIIQAAFAAGGANVTGINSGYTAQGANSPIRSASLINTTSTTTPTWTVASSQNLTGSVISFYDVPGFHANVSVIVVGP